MFLDRILARKAERSVARRLYDGAVARARQPALYAQMGAPDTPEGRFEILTLHVILLIDRLRGDTPAASHLRQALFDVYLSDLDGALREMSVGDLAVGKRMKTLGQAFYGRARAYDDAFKSLPSLGELESIVARTALDGLADVDPGPLASYIARTRERLTSCQTSALLDGSATWLAG
ncbi:MAG: ubiquinol-cytochrome C reductase [Pseudomonadota bacterium]|nr:ubiquinol-cytochrome C reductase [Pseudomonadota bacterium]